MNFVDDDQYFKVLLDKIHQDHGLELHDYRSKCLGRRIQSRLRATGNISLKEYIDLLDSDPEEYKKLLDAITINVTEFFRNPTVFTRVRELVLPELIKRKKEEGKKFIRVWSAGCSSGEEAYTMAILLSEFLGQDLDGFTVKIIGTDIDKKVLEKAILGEFEPEMLKEVPPNLLKKYFVPSGRNYIVSDRLRMLTRFQHHNLVNDHPLINIDIILCRNVVIYFTRDLTAAVYAGFYEALSDKGYLVLGKVEALWGEINRYFKAVDQKERIYQKMV